MTEEPPALKRKGRAAAARLRDYGGSGGGGGRNLWGKRLEAKFDGEDENHSLIDKLT
jgi:hypothetical protein